ncbi:MAG TPA: helix-turn-helix domain-containing protein [Solirubrobacterales bacterium]|nr:helix-turn-helix domain-containing protein [Solirubrobacterales bacterium]
MARPDDGNQDLLAALSHPLRRRILRLLPDEDERAMSPGDIARELDEELTHISYHVRVLADCGAAKLVRTEKVRGATRHFYRQTIEAGWAREVLAESEPEDESP